MVAGCGGSATSDQQQIAQTVQTYLHAAARGDGATACDQLTSHEAIEVFGHASEALPELQVSSCADAVSKVAGSLGGSRARLQDGTVKVLSINGDEATAEVIGGTQHATLTKEAGHWLISGGLT